MEGQDPHIGVLKTEALRREKWSRERPARLVRIYDDAALA